MRAAGSVYRRLARYLVGRRSQVPYTLVDMTDDVVAFEVRNVAVFNGPNFLPPDVGLRRRV